VLYTFFRESYSYFCSKPPVHIAGTFEELSKKVQKTENFKILVHTFITGHQVVKYFPSLRIIFPNVNTEIQVLNNYAGYFINSISKFNT
jgi:hypothetical protein